MRAASSAREPAVLQKRRLSCALTQATVQLLKSVNAITVSGVPFIERLDVDEGHFPVGPGHDTIVFTADDKVDVISKLPPAVTTRTARRTHYKIQCCGWTTPDSTGQGHLSPRADLPVSDGGDLILIHVVLHKWVWVGEIVSFSSL